MRPQHAAWSLRRQRGVTTVELAIALLLTLTIILSALDAARLVFAHSNVAYAARGALRYAAVRGTEAGADSHRPIGDAPTTEQKIESYLQSTNVAPVRVTAVWPPVQGGGVSRDAGSVLAVTVEADFIPIMPLLDPITISSTSRMVIFY